MLQKLRARHPIDIPAEGFGRSKGLLAVWGTLAVLAVIIPFVLAILEGALVAVLSIGAAVATLLVVLLLLGAGGAKPGYNRIGRGGR